jgi:hypothetical protein
MANRLDIVVHDSKEKKAQLIDFADRNIKMVYDEKKRNYDELGIQIKEILNVGKDEIL